MRIQWSSTSERSRNLSRRWSWCEAGLGSRLTLGALAGVALLLVLANLGNMYLWQDEAETALLSQRLGEFGLPLAFDGRNLIRQAPKDVEYTDEYVWVYHPWLPVFFTAASIGLVGATPLARR